MVMYAIFALYGEVMWYNDPNYEKEYTVFSVSSVNIYVRHFFYFWVLQI